MRVCVFVWIQSVPILTCLYDCLVLLNVKVHLLLVIYCVAFFYSGFDVLGFIFTQTCEEP